LNVLAMLTISSKVGS